MKSKYKLFLIFFLIFGILFRFVNLGRTARFTRDEASDLNRIHQYWQDKKLTLVGPISADNKKVFSSLTYYMLMPFAVVGDFNPLSVVYGTAFWGVLSLVILFLINYKVNKEYFFLAGLLLLIWRPLLVSSRWAWNPHFVIFWISAGILFYFYKTWFSFLIAGFLLSLSIHHHYISFAAVGIFIIANFFNYLKQKKIGLSLSMAIGFIPGIIPFILFDLRHPPGLFFGKYLKLSGTPDIDPSLSSDWFRKLSQAFFETFKLLGIRWQWLAVIVGGLVFWLLIRDFKKKYLPAIIFSLAFISQILVTLVLRDYWERYFYPGLPFLFVWLILPRKKIGGLISKILIIIFLVGSIFNLPQELIYTQVQPNINTLNAVVDKIVEVAEDKNIEKTNLAVLSSPDNEPFGDIYRYVLNIRGIDLDLIGDYTISDKIFIISTAELDLLLEDDSSIMDRFKKVGTIEKYPIENYDWKVYWFQF
jgi:hypothetical protein